MHPFCMCVCVCGFGNGISFVGKVCIFLLPFQSKHLFPCQMTAGPLLNCTQNSSCQKKGRAFQISWSHSLLNYRHSLKSLIFIELNEECLRPAATAAMKLKDTRTADLMCNPLSNGPMQNTFHFTHISKGRKKISFSSFKKTTTANFCQFLQGRKYYRLFFKKSGCGRKHPD